jgi:hypothetical protein
MCTECKYRKEQEREKKCREIMKKHNIVDEYSNGYGMWCLSTRASVSNRKEAWKKIGFSPSIASYMAWTTLTPKIAKEIGMDVKYLPCLGEKTAKKLMELDADAEESFRQRIEYRYEEEIEYSKDHFEHALKRGYLTKEKYDQCIKT